MVEGMPVKAFVIIWVAASVPAIAAEPLSGNIAQASDTSRKLEEHMEMQVKDHHFRGTALVVQNGRRLLARGRFPDDHTTVIVLSNLEDAGVVAPFLAAIVFGQEFKMPSQ